MKRPFRQPAQAEKNKWNRPSEPGRFFLLPKTQPENDRKRAKRNIKPFNFDQSPFSDDSPVNHPDEPAVCRSPRPQPGPGTRNKTNPNQKKERTHRQRAGPSFWVPQILDE